MSSAQDKAFKELLYEADSLLEAFERIDADAYPPTDGGWHDYYMHLRAFGERAREAGRDEYRNLHTWLLEQFLLKEPRDSHREGIGVLRRQLEMDRWRLDS